MTFRLRPLLIAVPAVLALRATAQEPPPLDALVLRLAAMTAVSGYEQRATDTLAMLLPGSRRDRAGNLLLTLGDGEPKSLIACPLDEPGYVVGGIRPDGYLTLRRVGRARGPLADQQIEGQRVTVWGRRGAVPGVVGVRSIHLTNGRPPLPDTPFSVDEALVDIGADKAATVASLGIGVLSPVALAKRPVVYADSLLAAPAIGRRAACAALLRAARTTVPARGSVVVAFVVEQLFTQRGLLTVGRNLGPFADALLLDGGPGADRIGSRTSPDPTSLGSFEAWLLPVRYLGSAVETVSLREVAALERGLTFRIRGGE
jgi:putative aminopeptidase FrvX